MHCSVVVALRKAHIGLQFWHLGLHGASLVGLLFGNYGSLSATLAAVLAYCLLARSFNVEVQLNRLVNFALRLLSGVVVYLAILR